MSIVVDASAVVALLVEVDEHHGPAARLVEQADDDLICTPMVLAEMDFVIGRRGGRPAQQELRRNFARGALQVRWWADALEETLAIAEDRPELGLADASLVALADRLRTDRIFTFDLHFQDLTTPRGRTLVRLP